MEFLFEAAPRLGSGSERRTNAQVVPWAPCLLFYSLMHFTAPADRRAFLAGRRRAAASDEVGGEAAAAAVGEKGMLLEGE